MRDIAEEARQLGCGALAISGFASVINPEHERRIAEIAYEATGLPAVCGHELTTELNFMERAVTAAMNARLIPLVEHLLDAIRDALNEAGVKDARIMIVKGDGSQMLDQVARRYPVETILSGPAASVVGACRLFNVPDAVVVDMGGTTTDVAATERHAPLRSARGASIGAFQTSVRAMDLKTIGLGGDSEIDLSDWPAVGIGPRRITPVCRLGAETNRDTAWLANTLNRDLEPKPHSLEIVESVSGEPKENENAVLQTLTGGPEMLIDVATRLDRPGPDFISWEQLETAGAIRRFGLTPTDVMHAEGTYVDYDVQASRILLNAWSETLQVPVPEIIEAIHHRFRSLVLQEILGMTLAPSCPWDQQSELRHWLAAHLTGRNQGDETNRPHFAVDLGRPLIPVGAPAPTLFPQLADTIQQDVLLSEWTHVANAVGAITGDVMLQETAAVRITEEDTFLCSWRGGNCRAYRLEEALQNCENALTALLKEEAEANDIEYSAPNFTVQPHEGSTRDGKVLLGLTFSAEING